MTGNDAKKNYLKSVFFETPDYIPVSFCISPACYEAYPPEELFKLMECHPFLFPDFKAPDHFEPVYELNMRKDVPYRDDFGCIWKTMMNGIIGTVQEHPLEDWSAYETYVFPDPEKSNGLGPVNWEAFEEQVRCMRAAGHLTCGCLRHGHTFLQLCDLRGYENLLFDMMDEEPLLDDLVLKLEAFNMVQIRHFLKADVDMVQIPEDLGMQQGPMLSVDNFLRYIKPSYQRMIASVKEAGKIVHMHSDGDIRLLSDHLIESGVDLINLQDLVNGIDWIREKLQGRICVELDIDRQKITPYGTPDKAAFSNVYCSCETSTILPG
ncbi:MAG: hypothetical protein MR332_12915 [Fusicatenibacter sp.]|nr:hypothetical protein [Fusicatenibacter sp.]